MSSIFTRIVSFLIWIITYNNKMTDIRKSLGNIIKLKRKQLKMTQAELAAKVEVEPKYISRIETGASYPSLSVVEKIFNTLGLEIKDLITEDENADKSTLISIINSNLKQTSLKNICLINEILEQLSDKS